jgi:hypothetical protein
MTTAGDIISEALKAAGVTGVGQAAAAEDVTDALIHLNQLIGQWNRKRWLVWHLVDAALTSTGAQTYTVGPGGNFDIPRPDRLEAAYVRQLIAGSPNLVDYPLEILNSREDYSRIRLKTLTSWPQAIFYDAAYPLGVVHPHPVPQAGLFEIHLVVKDTLSQVAAPGTALNLPPEYEAALLWNLAARLRSAYQLPPDPVAIGLAKDALNVIRNADAQIPRLRMPGALGPGGVYNIFSDGGAAD